MVTQCWTDFSPVVPCVLVKSVYMHIHLFSYRALSNCLTVLPFDAFFKNFEMRRVKPITGDLSEMVLGEEEDRGEEVVVNLVNTGGEKLRSLGKEAKGPV